ncbi:T6SS phospholipase effector Tle1-like catalytic domain-containing protein [Paraburkholderia hospita]|uniref:phospholipase effector Tle1 domain-containing protein n=1 Tax=Paraburkholderia hospita TaxID=169430 RepID=UPI0009A773F4|nr:DUF2235 domain-containing protein [Paraburkholderia hospita]SKD06314.1 Uncharacterized protein, PA2063/DUF2235 family [Paraburkholderia hospita]
MTKTIVYCADGTWNGPGSTAEEREKDPPGKSNVYKVYRWLQGVAVDHPDGGIGLERQEKKLTRTDGDTEQLALYCHGVGSNKLLPDMVVLGGTLGGGLTTRIRLGYSYISTNYEPDDSIVIVGFSRGAYTARALADMIATRGLLRPEMAKDHGPYSHSAVAWIMYRERQVANRDSASSDLRQRIIKCSQHLHGKLLETFGRKLTDADFVPADVTAVAVFDTVGSMGIPAYDRGEDTLIDEYEFDSEELHPKIGRAFHAVSLDEQRENFEPTLWIPDARLKQELFAGAHSDVGGGYKDDHGLSDVPLKWMIEQLTEVGLKFVDSAAMKRDGLAPNALGTAHQPWRDFLFSKLGHQTRQFPDGYVTVNEAVWRRMEGGAVRSDPDLPAPYDPPNLPSGIARQ